MDTIPGDASSRQRTGGRAGIAARIVGGAFLLVLSSVAAASVKSDGVHPVLVPALALMLVIGAALFAVGCVAQGIVARRQDPML